MYRMETQIQYGELQWKLGKKGGKGGGGGGGGGRVGKGEI